MDQFNLQVRSYEQEFEFANSSSKKFKNMSTTTEYETADKQTTTAKPSRTIKFQVEAEQIIQVGKSNEPKEPQQVDQRKLSQFLKKVYPQVIAALDESSNLKLLHQFEPLASGSRRDTTELYCLQNLAQRSLEIERKLEITDIQWNANGFMIAGSYGSLEHDGSCNDRSFISVWNLSKRDFTPDKATYTIETQGCVMCLAFHPSKPSILAAGLFTGQILIFDLSASETELCKSEMDEYYHRESITQLQWLEMRGVTVQFIRFISQSLMSLGTDGKLLLWPINFESISLQFPLRGHCLLRKKESQVEGVGGTCFAQCQEDQTNFIIGSEGGSVLRGLVHPISYEKRGHAILEGKEGGITWREDAQLFMGNMNPKFLPEIKAYVDEYCKRRSISEVSVKQIILAKPDIRKLYINPISFAYEAHYGTVFGISSSPFLKNLFLTCSMDGQVRMYEITNARSLMTFEYVSTYLLSVQFSPFRANVFAAATSSGEILLFDLKSERRRESRILKPANLQSNQSATNIRFNCRQQDLLACSYTGCQVRVFQLSDQFALRQEGEEEYLLRLLEIN